MSEPAGQHPVDEAVQRRRMTIALSLIAVLAAIAVIVVGAVVGAGGGGAIAGSESSADETATPRPAPPTPPAPAVVDTFDKAAHSLDDPASIWVVVNQVRALNPQDYVPDDLVEVPVAHTWVPELRQEASDAAVAMFAAAADEADLYLASNSAYRSYDTQAELYGDGDDPTTAPPGHSEHQTGLAMDIGTEGGCSFECMDDSVEGEWIRANGHRFGFILRYPADKVEITGYPHESWHFRYVGPELATEMHERGVTTLEEFFGVEGGAAQ